VPGLRNRRSSAWRGSQTRTLSLFQIQGELAAHYDTVPVCRAPVGTLHRFLLPNAGGTCELHLVCRYSQPSFRTVGLTSCTLDSRCIDLGLARTILDDSYIEPFFRLVGLARTPFIDRYIWPSFRQAAAITSYLQRALPRGFPQDFRLSCLSRK
jgi:hypothetical protein